MISQLLELCDKYDLHIKEKEIHDPVGYDTHYIMQGGDVLTRLNLAGIPHFVRGVDNRVKSVLAILEAENIETNDFDKCIKSLSETVGAKGNIEIYKRYIYENNRND
jgi:hypothetical protein